MYKVAQIKSEKDYDCIVLHFKVKECDASKIIHLKIAIDIHGILCFHLHFRILEYFH